MKKKITAETLTPYLAAKFILQRMVLSKSYIRLDMSMAFGMSVGGYFGHKVGDYIVIKDFYGRKTFGKFSIRKIQKEILKEVMEKL